MNERFMSYEEWAMYRLLESVERLRAEVARSLREARALRQAARADADFARRIRKSDKRPRHRELHTLVGDQRFDHLKP